VSTEEQKHLGEALGRVPSGLFIVTAGQGSETTGFLASWVQQAGFEPALISLAVKKGRPIEKLLVRGCGFVIHVTGKKNKRLVRHFLKGFGVGENAFEGFKTSRGTLGAPIITSALAYMECEYFAHYDAGDHILVLGKVVAGEILHPNDEPFFHSRPTGFHY